MGSLAARDGVGDGGELAVVAGGNISDTVLPLSCMSTSIGNPVSSAVR